jgi:hypothetical protein
MGTSCKYLKKMSEVKGHFMRYLSLSSWEIAEEKYPQYTQPAQLEPFLSMTFKNNSIPPAFVAYCKQAKLLFSHPSSRPVSSSVNVMVCEARNHKSLIFNMDVLKTDEREMMSAVSGHLFTGFHLTLINPPNVRRNRILRYRASCI